MSQGAEADILAAAKYIIRQLTAGQILVWPYLDEKFAALVREEFSDALVLPCDSGGVISLGETGFEGWLANLGRARRKKVKREQRLFNEMGATVEINNVNNKVPVLAQLFAAHKEMFGGMADPAAMAKLLEAQVDVFGDRLLSIESHLDGRIHAACTVIQHEGALYCRSFGALDRIVPFEYFVLCYYAPIRIAEKFSASYLHLGRGSEEAKLHRGAEFFPRWTAFWGYPNSEVKCLPDND